MALYEIGQEVWATKELITAATGDHPAFLHARPGQKLYVIEHKPGQEQAYKLSTKADGSYPFWASPLEIMGQRPFGHNV